MACYFTNQKNIEISYIRYRHKSKNNFINNKSYFQMKMNFVIYFFEENIFWGSDEPIA